MQVGGVRRVQPRRTKAVGAGEVKRACNLSSKETETGGLPEFQVHLD